MPWFQKKRGKNTCFGDLFFMIGVVRWVEEGGLSFLKGAIGKYNTKDSVCWFFPSDFGPRKRNLVERVQRL